MSSVVDVGWAACSWERRLPSPETLFSSLAASYTKPGSYVPFMCNLPPLEMVSTQLEIPVRKLIQGEQFLRVPHLCREKATHAALIYNVVFSPRVLRCCPADRP